MAEITTTNKEIELKKEQLSVARRLRAKWLQWEMIPVAYLALLVVFALWPSLFTTYDPYALSLGSKLTPAGTAGHLLGTDELGRDILTRIIYGARPTLIVAASSLALGGVLGTVIGMVSGFFGGFLDSVLMRTADTFLSLPMILLALFLVMVFGPGTINVVLAVGLLIWARYARVIRGEVLKLKEQDFIALARVSGCPWWYILRVHLLPNIMPTLLVLVTLQVGWVVIVEASLSFLGAGIPAPTPAWGSMVADGRGLLSTAWWVSTFPGLVIAMLVLSFNMIGDRLRDALDPRLRSV